MSRRVFTLLTALVATSYPAFGSDPSIQHLQNSPHALIEDIAGSQSGIVEESDQLAMDRGLRFGSSEISTAGLGLVSLSGTSDGQLRLAYPPSLQGKIGDRHAGVTTRNNIVFYTLDPALQSFVSRTVSRANAAHVAIVAMNAKTGAILAIAGRSPTIDNIEYHSGFPAASLFKVVTAAAAVEEAGIDTDSIVPFRGGTYTLNKWNYLPNPKADKRTMSVGEALGRSCNPVFGHLGIKYLDGSILYKYAEKFGFNRSLAFEVPISKSTARIPRDDRYQLSRTSAGFGKVYISPVHAAAVAAAVANGGLLPRPHIIDRITDSKGITLEKTQPEALLRVVQPQTASTLLEMMQYTTTIGTSRREFMVSGRPTLGNIEVAGKTGTLTGFNPPGLNNWFIGAAPLNNPELAVAVITVNGRYSSKASHLARLVMQRYFDVEPIHELPERRVQNISPKAKYKRPSTTSKFRDKTSKKSTTRYVKKNTSVKVSKKK